MRANEDCVKAIEDTIRDNFDGMYLQCDAKDVIQQFGRERVTYLLANTIQEREWDGRFSNSNKEWAASLSVPEPIARFAPSFLITSHPAILDGFVKQAREDLKAVRAQPVKKPSIRAQCAEKPVPSERPSGQQPSKDKGAR